MTASLSGAATDVWTEIVVRFSDVLPTYPSTAAIPPVRVPAPALLTGSDQGAWCMQLVVAYHATMPHFFPVAGKLKDHARLTVRDLYAIRTLVALQNVAAFMKKHDVRPHVWCAMSSREHIKISRRATRPPLAWVYQLARLKKFDWLYMSEDAAVRGNRVQLTKAHQQLIRRYEYMRLRLIAYARKRKRCGQELTPADVQTVVDAHLPAHVYRALVREARSVARARQADLRTLFDQGDYLW